MLIINTLTNLFSEIRGFITRNEGEIVGTFGAGLVAIFAVWLTHVIHARKERRQQENLYCGILDAIGVDLNAHQLVFRDLVRELSVVRQESIRIRRLIIATSPTKVPLHFMNVCRTKVLEFDRFNTRLLNFISSYINSCDCLNSSLDFTPIIQVQQQSGIEGREEESINAAFRALYDHIKKLRRGRRRLRDDLIQEVQRFPGNVVVDEND